MLIVGLTGGIATGKSTVTSLLREQGVTVLDCDEIAHAVVRQAGLMISHSDKSTAHLTALQLAARVGGVTSE